jgi:hypothetical protein
LAADWPEGFELEAVAAPVLNGPDVSVVAGGAPAVWGDSESESGDEDADEEDGGIMQGSFADVNPDAVVAPSVSGAD